MADVPFGQLLERARALAGRPGRALLGITGPPAAGKSTLAERLRAELGAAAAYVPLDGFHLAHQLLVENGLAERKGAPDTFDAAGYVALLRRLRDPAEGVVYAPRFDRDIEDSIANAIPVPPDVPLVITEGNYLLLRSGPWAQVAGLLDEVWYIELAEDTRLRRLIGRHMEFGRDSAEARDRATGSDQRNAVLIEAGRDYASLVVSVAAAEFRCGETGGGRRGGSAERGRGGP
jgi:pantothenate kinase